MVSSEASAISFIGDIFEFWLNKKLFQRALPLVSNWLSFAMAAPSIEAFTGNHDLWMFGHFLNRNWVPVHKSQFKWDISGKTFHRTWRRTGSGDTGYKLMKKYLYIRLVNGYIAGYSTLMGGIRFTTFFSQTSGSSYRQRTGNWLGEEKEWLFQYW